MPVASYFFSSTDCYHLLIKHSIHKASSHVFANTETRQSIGVRTASATGTHANHLPVHPSSRTTTSLSSCGSRYQAYVVLQRWSPITLTETALPDPQTRRETLDFLRSDLERLRQEHDLVCLLCIIWQGIKVKFTLNDNQDTLQSHLSSFRKLVKQMTPSFSFSGSNTGSRLIGQRRRAQG